MIAVLEVPFFDLSLYEKQILELDFHNPFDKVPSLPKKFRLSDDKVFATLNFSQG